MKYHQNANQSVHIQTVTNLEKTIQEFRIDRQFYYNFRNYNTEINNISLNKQNPQPIRCFIHKLKGSICT